MHGPDSAGLLINARAARSAAGSSAGRFEEDVGPFDILRDG
jgi:hypothetical protein